MAHFHVAIVRHRKVLGGRLSFFSSTVLQNKILIVGCSKHTICIQLFEIVNTKAMGFPANSSALI